MKIANLEDMYELSPMQQGMLFHSLYAPKAMLYYGQLSCLIRGGLDVGGFIRAWEHVVERHSILRTRFVWSIADKPIQVVYTKIRIPFHEEDWRGRPPNAQDSQIKRYLWNLLEQGFEPTQFPMMHLALFRLDEDAYRFIWCYHHILMDGWSSSLVLEEVFSIYRALWRGREIRLQTVRPYSDYIGWLQEQDTSDSERYWRRTLKDFTKTTTLWVDQAPGRLPSEEETYDRQELILSEEETERLKHFTKEQQLTMNTILQGVWSILVSSYSGDDDIVFGVVMSGRPVELPGIERMIGLFINTLPIRVRLCDHVSVVAWLKDLQEENTELRRYEYTPLIDVHRWSEMPRGNPLFETIFAFDNYPVDRSVTDWCKEMDVQDVQIREWTSYPLAVMVAADRRLAVKIIYDYSRFERSRVTDMLSEIRTLILRIIENPGVRLGELAGCIGMSEKHEFEKDAFNL